MNRRSVFKFLAIALLLATSCVRSSPQLLLGDVVFITQDGKTEIQLSCLNLSDMHIIGITADVTIQHVQTEKIIDKVREWVGDIEPRGLRWFSVWTDKLVFTDDAGVRASFTYRDAI